VRDLILGVKNLDLDIVVEGDGIKFAEDLATILKAKLIRHGRFGTATVTILHKKIDIATARKEIYPYPASLPEVTPGKLNDDLSRRDFTINAMAISISGKNPGRLIDIFSGKRDLRHKKIRILHTLSFIDDPTRILRAIRFEKRYNFEIESKTLKHLKEAVKLRMLEKVQPQRIRDDLILILKEKEPLKQIKRLQVLVGLDFISPHLSVSKKTFMFLNSINEQIDWFGKVYHDRRSIDAWLIYFLGLIDSLGAQEVKSICQKYVFRKGEEKRIFAYKKIDAEFISQLSEKKIKPSKIFSLLEPLSYEVILALKAKYKNRYLVEHIEDFLEIYNGMCIYTSGYDLNNLGITPGPSYQEIFTKVLNAKLDGLVKTKKEELTLIRKLIGL
jgi:tRNA nucleotidyltransferase (CCA-adding enzyme)